LRGIEFHTNSFWLDRYGKKEKRKIVGDGLVLGRFK
jgi:hypothetical protein